MKIITNHQPRLVLTWDQLTPKEQEEIGDPDGTAAEHDYIRYRGRAYDISGEFMYYRSDDWDGSLPDSAFSGILVKFVGQDHVIMGRWYS